VIKELVRFSHDDLVSPTTSAPPESIFEDFEIRDLKRAFGNPEQTQRGEDPGW